MSARARNIDPASSHEAAAEVESTGAVRYKQERWLRLLAKFHAAGNVTATRSELANFYAEQEWESYRNDPRAYDALITGATQVGKAQIGRRFPEMEEHGLIKCTGIRKCEVAGRSCKAWAITAIGKAAL